jgi:DNA-binding NarL/FixJ family response regulator
VISVLVVEDDPVVGAGVGSLFVGPDFHLVGVTRWLDEGVRWAIKHQPHVIVCDVLLGGAPDGLDLPARLRGTAGERCSVVYLTTFDAPYFIARAVEAGAAGYVLKSSELDGIIDAVRTAAIGGTSFPAAMLRTATTHRAPAPRERQIIETVAAGAANSEIGVQVGISEKTVETYLARMYARYGVASRTQLAMYALWQGWITPPPDDKRLRRR